MKRHVALLTFLLVLGFSQSALAVTGLGPGYYQHNNAAIAYTGSWTTSADANAYGGTLTYTSTGGTATFYTLSTVGTFGVFYVGQTVGGFVDVYIDGVLSYTVNTYNSVLTYNMYAWFPLTAGPHKIILIGRGGWFDLIAIELLAPNPVIAVTSVVVFPTHTPTPTYTPTVTPSPTLTNTPGPSPTPTATITATANYVLRSTVVYGEGEHQDVAVVYQISAGDILIGVALFILIALLIFEIIRREWRE
jgi:hypothetical protein